MSDEIEIKEASATNAAEIIINQARPGGWMAWYRFGQTDFFNQVYEKPNNNMDRDYYRCPYPLFTSRDDAIDAAKYQLRGRGGEIRVVQVTL